MNEQRPKVVAVIDDDARIRTLLRLELEDFGAMVQCCRSGEEALAVLDPTALDLVLLDVGLPGMGGLDCLQQLRLRGLRARVLLMSGHWDPPGEEQIRAFGADGFVVKTALPQKLAELMAGGG